MSGIMNWRWTTNNQRFRHERVLQGIVVCKDTPHADLKNVNAIAAYTVLGSTAYLNI